MIIFKATGYKRPNKTLYSLGNNLTIKLAVTTLVSTFAGN